MMLSSQTDPFVRIESYYRDKGYYGPILEIWELLPRKIPVEAVIEDRVVLAHETSGLGSAAKKFLLTLRSHAVMETVLTAAILISFFVINAVAHTH
jgi:hypothetical protein